MPCPCIGESQVGQAPFLIVLFFSPTATSQVPVDSGSIVAPSTTTTAYYLAHPLASLEAFAGFMQAATSFKASKGRKKERKKQTFLKKARPCLTTTFLSLWDLHGGQEHLAMAISTKGKGGRYIFRPPYSSRKRLHKIAFYFAVRTYLLSARRRHQEGPS